MSLVKNKKTGMWESYITDRAFGRLHISMRTKRSDEAKVREAAFIKLVREGDRQLIEDLRNQKIKIEEVARLDRTRKPFEELNASLHWPTFSAACAEYLLAVEHNPKRAKNTLIQARHYLNAARACFGDSRDKDNEWLGGGKRVDEITGDNIEGFVKTLTERDLSSWSVALGLQRVAAVFNWLSKREVRRAAEEKRTPRFLHNPVDRDLIPERTETRTRFLSEAEATRLIAAAPPSMHFPILAGVMAGLRIGEVANLRPSQDIDLEHGLIIIQNRVGWKPKTRNSSREIPFGAELRPVIERHIREFASDRWMLPRTTGDAFPLSQHALTQRFTRVVGDADLVTGRADPMGVTFHTLRHTFASWLVMKGVDLFTVAKLLGHGSIDMVVKTYGHLSPDHKARAAGHLGAWLASVTPMVSLSEEAKDVR